MELSRRSAYRQRLALTLSPSLAGRGTFDLASLLTCARFSNAREVEKALLNLGMGCDVGALPHTC